MLSIKVRAVAVGAWQNLLKGSTETRILPCNLILMHRHHDRKWAILPLPQCKTDLHSIDAHCILLRLIALRSRRLTRRGTFLLADGPTTRRLGRDRLHLPARSCAKPGGYTRPAKNPTEPAGAESKASSRRLSIRTVALRNPGLVDPLGRGLVIKRLRVAASVDRSESRRCNRRGGGPGLGPTPGRRRHCRARSDRRGPGAAAAGSCLPAAFRAGFPVRPVSPAGASLTVCNKLEASVSSSLKLVMPRSICPVRVRPELGPLVRCSPEDARRWEVQERRPRRWASSVR